MGPKDDFNYHDIQSLKNLEIDKTYFSVKNKTEGHLINIFIYRGEHLVPLNS